MNLVELCRPETEDYISVNPEFGAQLVRLVLRGQSVLKYPLKDGDSRKGWPSAFLFPFSGLIKDGRFSFGGESFRLDINDPESNCTTGGLISFESFEVVSQTGESVFMMHEYTGNKKGFPFPFKFGVEYVLEEGCLEVRAGVKNTGDTSMPFSFGWHPYFGFNDEAIGQMELDMPGCKHIKLNDRGLPAGETHLLDPGKMSLKNTMLNDIFYAGEEGGFVTVKLISGDRVLSVSQKAGEDGLNYITLFIPPGRNCIAIQPSTSNTDALNNAEGLIVLEAGKSRSFITRISI